MKIPRRSAKFLRLVEELDAEFLRHGRPAPPGWAANQLAEAIQRGASDLGVTASHFLTAYIRDSWPTTVAAQVVAEVDSLQAAIVDTPPVEMDHADALAVAHGLSLIADWIVRVHAKVIADILRARVATGALMGLLNALSSSDTRTVTFGGRPLAEARIAIIWAVEAMRAYSNCPCPTDIHDATDDGSCPIIIEAADRLVPLLHQLGGVMPALEHHRPNGGGRLEALLDPDFPPFD